MSAGAGVDVGSGNAAVFVSEVVAGVTIIVGAAVALDSLTGAVMINGVGGITTEVASAGPATSGISSAETVGVEMAGAAFTIVGDGIDRASEATTSEGTTLKAASAGKGRIEGSVMVASVGGDAGVGAKAGAAAGGVVSGSSSAGSGNGICLRGFSGIGIGVVAGAAGVTGVVSGTGSLGSSVGIGVGAGVVAGTGGTGPFGFVDGSPAGVVVAGVPVCGIGEGVPGLTAAPGTAGGVETAGLPDAAEFDVAGPVPGVVVDGVVAAGVPDGNGCEFEMAFVFCGC